MGKDKHVGSGLVVHAAQKRGGVYSLDKLCYGRTVVLKVFGRFGCPFTRLEATRLSKQVQQLKEFNASLVGIGFDEEGVSDFRKGKFWDGELYLDHDRHIYDFFELHRVSKFQVFRIMMQKQTRQLYSSLKNELGANLQGDALQTGGIFVINCKGRVLYACPQSDIAVFTDLPAIQEICRKEFTRRTFKPVPAFTDALKANIPKEHPKEHPKERPKRHSLAIIPSRSIASSPTMDSFLLEAKLLRRKISIEALKE